MTGGRKVAVVSGGTRGIGLAVSTGLAQAGFDLAIIGQSAVNGRTAAAEIRRVAPGARVDFHAADLSTMAEVRRLASALRGAHPKIDLLIHNAAVVTPNRQVTAEGLETQFAVNHLAVYLLTHELLAPLLAAGGRIVVTASQVEQGGQIAFDDLQSANDYDGWRAYRQSKLANVLFTYRAAEQLRGTNVTINCLHPGVVRTELLNTLGAISWNRRNAASRVPNVVRAANRVVRGILRKVGLLTPPSDDALTPSEGAKTTLYVALSPALNGVTGRYFRECREGQTSTASHDRDLGQRLWETSARLAGVAPDWAVAANSGHQAQ